MTACTETMGNFLELICTSWKEKAYLSPEEARITPLAQSHLYSCSSPRTPSQQFSAIWLDC